jgi:sodium-coupled neutral amino acid transporter 11
LASFHPKLKHLGVLTFEDLMFMPFGKLGSDFVLLNMFVLGYGAMVAYLLVIKDTVPTILGITEDPDNGSFMQREGVMIVTSLLIIVPLSMQRDMASLAFTSVLSVSADLVLVLFVAAVSPIREAVGDAGGFVHVLKHNSVNSRLFIGLGILSTAMACQHSAFIVSGSLHNKTSKRWATATFWSITTSTIVCLILGICGYLGFLDEAEGNILNNFDPDSLEANTARTLLAITMFFTYPMECFVARHVLVKLWFDGDADGIVLNELGESVPEPKLWGFFTRRRKCTLVIYVATLLPALVVNDLGPVLSITGSLGGSCLCYIGTGLVYLGVNGDAFLSYLAALLVDSKTRNKVPFLVAAATVLELPIEGDATANMQTVVTPDLSSLYGPKPWWWYPTLMPVWVKIAANGAAGMQERLAAYEQEHESISPYYLSEGISSEGVSPVVEVETIGPCQRDYYISMFFICFGVLAAVAGVGSNVYFQFNENIFDTPT